MPRTPQDDRADGDNMITSVARALNSPWMISAAVLSVLCSVGWALYQRTHVPKQETTASSSLGYTTVELLGVPEDATVVLDGARQEKTVVTVASGDRHLVSVSSPSRGKWRQVFVVHGPTSLVVEPKIETKNLVKPIPVRTRATDKDENSEVWPRNSSSTVLDPWNN